MKAYCLKCKTQQEMSNAQEKTTKNGRTMMSGNCKECGTKTNKFVSK
jgi:RNase P subunit RPR2